MRVRQIESLAELAAAWRLVAEVLHQDDTHPRNFDFYARHLPHHPELLLVALAPDEEAQLTVPQSPGSADPPFAAASGGAPWPCGALLAHAEPDYVWIGKLAVAPTYRERGAGSALLALVEQHAAAAGYRRLMLGAAPEAETFYARRGYRPDVRRPPNGQPQRVFTKIVLLG